MAFVIMISTSIVVGVAVNGVSQFVARPSRACAQALSPQHLRELRSFTKLPPIVSTVLECVGVFLNVPDINLPVSRRRLLVDGFCDKLLNFDFEGVESWKYRRVRKLLATPGFDEETLRGVCQAAAPLASWCRAVAACLAITRSWGSVLDSNAAAAAAAAAANVGTTAAPAAAASAVPAGEVAAEVGNVNPKPRCELVINPDLSRLCDAELRRVNELEVTRPGVGSIVFHGLTDCRNLDVESLVHLDVGEVLVYPVQGMKPAPGHGLNKCATVTMYQCWPPNGRGHLEDPSSRERYRGKIRQMTEEKRARFIDYDCSTGVWKFQVEHF